MYGRHWQPYYELVPIQCQFKSFKGTELLLSTIAEVLKLGNIVTNFELYKCDECAVAVVRWLRDNNIEGQVIKLKTAYGEDYILSTLLINQDINSSITLSGFHYVVEVKGKVFDNLSTEGLTFEDWKNDFDCPLPHQAPFRYTLLLEKYQEHMPNNSILRMWTKTSNGIEFRSHDIHLFTL